MNFGQHLISTMIGIGCAQLSLLPKGNEIEGGADAGKDVLDLGFRSANFSVALRVKMFKSVLQSGLLSILYSCGSRPLAIWEKKVTVYSSSKRH